MIKDKTLKPFSVLPDGNKNSRDFQKNTDFNLFNLNFLLFFYDRSVRGILYLFIYCFLKCTHENGIWEK